ncbi:class I SAM-dependent methyltransferase [Microcoleus sp. FACHB-68]|uniref:class I SAM-dependent methyltransferase n=1 Tax=Microcoleus sp. FACHB-68 TaxID=2692826 RepID=UPI001686126F|nr:class I SAM-dependent methyltransferase [Microcoleus sp. FACHB-68]MBD1938820.1 class I SAM-dependent methyltransferase [Microcoleus sp. FACHB-68]
MSNLETIQQKKAEIIQKFGEWTNHNIQLDGDLYTISRQTITGAEVKLRRIVQMVADISGKSFENLRILDLACLEGLYGMELALQGANVVAIEGREANVEKARFAKDVLSVNNIEIIQDDVRNLSLEKYGKFDIVLCIGILYHLDVPDVFEFLEKISEVCQSFAIIDTQVSMVTETSALYKEKEYWGRLYTEHDPNTTVEERVKVLWSSLDNLNSFWFTRPSLYNFLSQIGFTSIYECHNPPVKKYEMMRLKKETDRSTFLAIKGKKVSLFSSQVMNDLPQEDWENSLKPEEL